MGSAFGVSDPHPPGSPMLAAAPQKACGDKKAGDMRGHPQLSDHGGNMHSSRLAFITDHRPCLWSGELGPLSAGPIREQKLCRAGAVGWTGFAMGQAVGASPVGATQREEVGTGYFRAQIRLAVGQAKCGEGGSSSDPWTPGWWGWEVLV